LIADVLYPFLESGFAEPVPLISKVVGENAVELANGQVLEDIDAIIYCTGYDFAVPFLSEEFNPYPVIGEPSYLYRGIIPLHPDPSVRDSLAFVGQAAVTFPGFVQTELQAMAVSQMWRGTSQIPSLDEMKQWHNGWLQWRKDLMARQKVKSTFYTAFVPLGDYLTWLDKTTGTGIFDNFGWLKPRAWAFWWKDKELYKLCKAGLFAPAIWRLFDMGKRKPMEWDRAKEMIFSENERAKKQVQRTLEAKKDV
jgi:dimethylaniline monooxygenase (N-oxide forming)